MAGGETFSPRSPPIALQTPNVLRRGWIQGVTGHGDFVEYYQRFGNPPEANKTCVCGQVVRRGRLDMCVSFCYLGQSRCSLARCSSFLQNLQSILKTCQRASPICEALDPSALEPLPIPINLIPRLPSPAVKADKEAASGTIRDCCFTSTPQRVISQFLSVVCKESVFSSPFNPSAGFCH